MKKSFLFSIQFLAVITGAAALFAAGPAPDGNTPAALSVTGTAAAAAGVKVEALPKAITPAAGSFISDEKTPHNLNASVDGMKVTLSWDKFEKEGFYYNVYRSTAEAGNFTAINKKPVEKNSFIDSAGTSMYPPKSNAVYFYKVTAFDGHNETGDSNIAQAKPTGPLLPPSNIRIIAGDSSIVLKWAEPESSGENGMSGYNIFRGTEPAGGLQITRTAAAAYDYTDAAGLTQAVKYYYWLQSVDSKGLTSPLSVSMSAAPFTGISAPRNVTISAASSESIKVLWEEPSTQGTYGLLGYQIYRSTDQANFPDTPVNERLIKPYPDQAGKTFYYDNIINSVAAPEPGVPYYYRVVPVDSANNTGASNTPVAGKIEFLKIEQHGMLSANISEYGLPPDSKLQLSGMKSITLDFSTTIWDTNDPNRGKVTPNLKIDQPLKLLLNGNIGSKIFVDINYNDNPALAVQNAEDKKISIKYVGDKDETLQELSFGDINFDMPAIRYVRPLASLFGIKGKASLLGDKLTFSGAWAQTKGITDTQDFVGTMRQKQTNGSPGITINDTSFIANTYYYLTKDVTKITALDPTNHSLNPIKVAPNSVLIYVDDQSVFSDNSNTHITPSGKYHFDRKELGIDYSVDEKNGVIKFNFGVAPTHIIAVAYKLVDSANNVVDTVGYDASGLNFDFTEANFVSAQDGRTANGAHLIKDNGNDITHEVMNYYSMGEVQINNQIADPSFDIKVYDMQNHDKGVPLPGDTNSANYYEIDWNLGIIKFKNFYPFRLNSTDIIYNGTDSTGIGTLNDPYNQTNKVSLYKMVFKYTFNVSSYKLDYAPVVANSERVFLNGNPQVKDRDYQIIYETGDIVFLHKENISPTAPIRIVYEYSPFLQTFDSTVLGTRLDYNALDNLKFGATYIRKDSAKGTTPPDARSTEFALSTPYGGYVWDANTDFTLKKEDINYIISSLPLVGKTDLPVDFKFDAEVAYSDLNQNTFDMNNEKGVAMIDNMEGTSNERSLNMVNTAWFPASVPPGLQPANRVFTQRSSYDGQGHEKTQSVSTGGYTPSLVKVLKVGFNGLTAETGNEKWDALRYNISASGENMNNYSYLDMWVKVKTDNPIKINVDIGVISEDSNGTGKFNYNDPGKANGESEDTIPAGQIKPNGQLDTGEDIGISPGIYAGMPGSTPAYWGAGNGGSYPDTEDMNNNGQLDTGEKYYRYSATAVAPYAGHPELSFSGSDQWVNIRIPLNQFSDSLNLSQSERTQGTTDFLALIKHVRLTFLGTTNAASNGTVEVESIKFVGNSWLLAVPSPAVPDAAGNLIDSPDTTKFDAISVNQNTDSSYKYNLNFFQAQTDSDKTYENSLDIKYNMSNRDLYGGNNPIYYVKKPFGPTSAYDYRSYKYLKMDVYYKTRDTSAGPGRTMFIRVGQGSDESTNYYQYNEQLDDIPNDLDAGNGWRTVIFRIDGSDKKRSFPDPSKTPNLRQVGIITIGFINPNSQAASEEFYIDNIRLTDPDEKQGMAKYLSSVLNITGVGTITHMYEDKETDFNSIDDITKSQMRRHLSVNSVRFTPTFLPFLSNFSNGYSRTQEYIEGKYQNDLSYNANNSVPDSDVESYESILGISQIPGFSFGSNLKFDKRRDIFYGTMVDASCKTNIFNWQPVASWTAPRDFFFIPLGSNKFDGNFDINSTDTDYLGNTNATYYPNWKMTVKQHYRWDGTYDIWKFNIAPSYDYVLSMGKGNLIGYLSDIANNYYTARYLVLERDIMPSLNIKLNDAWIFSPVIAYTTASKLDLGLGQQNTTGRLEAYSGLALNQIAGFLPNISKYSFAVDLNETYDNKYDSLAFSKYNTLTFERKWNIFLWKMLYDDREMKQLEDISSRGNINITQTLTFDTINIGDIASFNPSGSYGRSRYSQGRNLQDPTESWVFNAGTVQIKKITIPGLEFLVKDKTISAGYNFRRDITRSSIEIPETTVTSVVNGVTTTVINKEIKPGDITKDAGAHGGSIQLFYGLENSGLNGNIMLTLNRTDSRSGNENSWTLSMVPSLALNYILKKEDPFTVWDWVPGIGGKVFKFEQNLALNFTSSLTFNQGGSSSITNITKKTDSPVKPTTDTKTFYAAISGTYNVLQNLKATAQLAYTMKKDIVANSNSCQIIGIQLGGDLEF